MTNCVPMSEADDAKALADEIERRALKFADIVQGQYEMLSEHELDLVCRALRAFKPDDA